MTALDHLLSARFRQFLPVVIDIECGGFNSQTDAILQIAAVFVGFNEEGLLEPQQTLSFHVKPFKGANIEESALKFTGIDPFHPLRIDYPEEEVLKEIYQEVRTRMKTAECKRAILVAHNAHFDHGFLNAANTRCQVKRNPFHPFSSLDTASMAALTLGQTVLARACEAAGINFISAEAHSARYDAQLTAELFCYMVNRWEALGGWPLQGQQTITAGN